MRKRKPIKGSQLPSPSPSPAPVDNDLAPECIFVPKVYDWVFFSNKYENKNFIPDEDRREAVNKALAAGKDVDVECTPADPDDVICNVTIIENGNPGRVAIVWTVPVKVTVLINGDEACTFTVRTQFDDEIMLCVPEGITADNITCRATDVQCRTNRRPLMGPDPFGPMIPVKVLLCKEVQVEFPVKLEVLAKFCFPRPNDIPLPKDVMECPRDVFEFPPQCPDIFPPNNCECQATALARNEDTLATLGSDGTFVEGESTLEAEICQECALANSDFTYSFTDTDEADTGDFSFTFNARTADRVECDEVGDSLTVFGEGKRHNDGKHHKGGKSEHLFYELRIFSNPGSFQLILRNNGQVFDSGMVDALVRFDECDTFADLLNTDD